MAVRQQDQEVSEQSGPAEVYDAAPKPAEGKNEMSAMPSGEPVHGEVQVGEPVEATPHQADLAQEAAFKGALMSPDTDEIVSEAFERLKSTTMEGLEERTEALLRPMLSEWLDNNLPSLVERLVRDEIERVSRGR